MRSLRNKNQINLQDNIMIKKINKNKKKFDEHKNLNEELVNKFLFFFSSLLLLFYDFLILSFLLFIFIE